MIIKKIKIIKIMIIIYLGFPCFKSGVMNMGPCKTSASLPTGAPIALSYPHFYQVIITNDYSHGNNYLLLIPQADQSFRDAVIGMEPNKEKHQMYAKHSLPHQQHQHHHHHDYPYHLHLQVRRHPPKVRLPSCIPSKVPAERNPSTGHKHPNDQVGCDEEDHCDDQHRQDHVKHDDCE